MKDLVKRLAVGIATVLVSPMLVSYWIRKALFGGVKAIEGSSQVLSFFPGLPGQYLRRAFYMQVLEGYHVSATVTFGTIFSDPGTRLDENVIIGPRGVIGWAHIERDVMIGPHVHIPSGAQTHGIEDLTRPMREQPGVRKMVRIGAGAWIGTNAVVLADVGRETIVAAGSVVTKPLPDGVIAGGIPARIIKTRAEAARDLKAKREGGGATAAAAPGPRGVAAAG
ncbi:MAG TPA: acyltransferase [Thermoanaerobaculia bacterium]|nr:acyltransferase [Thermoanaerobaculia bacterium]